MGSKYLPQKPSKAVVSLLSCSSEVDTTDGVKQSITDEKENHLQYTRPSSRQHKIYFLKKNRDEIPRELSKMLSHSAPECCSTY